MVLNPDGSYPEKLTPSPSLLKAATYVGKNVDFIIVSSNTAHIFSKEIQDAANKTLLSLIDVSVDEVVRRNNKKVGILAIGLTIRKQLFQAPLLGRGIETVVLPKNLGDKLEDEAIYPVQEGRVFTKPPKILTDCVSYFKDKNVDSVILGCSEIPILLTNKYQSEILINPSQLIAETALRKSFS